MPQTEQGITKDRNLIIPRTLIFIRSEDSFLFIKGAADKRLWANKYNGIGGHLERGEDIQSAAERERDRQRRRGPRHCADRQYQHGLGHDDHHHIPPFHSQPSSSIIFSTKSMVSDSSDAELTRRD